MKQHPDAQALERLAGEILQDEALPKDRQARGYEQRMAAKALSIAQYDRASGESDMAEELRLFEKLYGAGDAVAASDTDRLGALNRRLAVEVRVGKWDDAPDALRNLLMAQTQARLRRVNPRYLKSREGGVD